MSNKVFSVDVLAAKFKLFRYLINIFASNDMQLIFWKVCLALVVSGYRRWYFCCRHHSQEAEDGGQEEEEIEPQQAAGVSFAL